jgi:hypothetical protein
MTNQNLRIVLRKIPCGLAAGASLSPEKSNKLSFSEESRKRKGVLLSSDLFMIIFILNPKRKNYSSRNG